MRVQSTSNGSFALERDARAGPHCTVPGLRRGVVTEIGEVVDRLVEPYLPPRRGEQARERATRRARCAQDLDGVEDLSVPRAATRSFDAADKETADPDVDEMGDRRGGRGRLGSGVSRATLYTPRG